MPKAGYVKGEAKGYSPQGPPNLYRGISGFNSVCRCNGQEHRVAIEEDDPLCLMCGKTKPGRQAA